MDPEELKLNAKLKHLEMIQAVVTRMANNSFLVAGWCITLVAGLMALAGGKDGNVRFVYVAYLPVIVFWYLNGYFLQQERIFRKIYDLYIGALETGNPPAPVAPPMTGNPPLTDFKITPLSLPPNLLAEIRRDNTVPRVMWSNTLRILYGIILLSVIVATVILNGWLGSPARKKLGLALLFAALLLLTERFAGYAEKLVRLLKLDVPSRWLFTRPK